MTIAVDMGRKATKTNKQKQHVGRCLAERAKELLLSPWSYEFPVILN